MIEFKHCIHFLLFSSNLGYVEMYTTRHISTIEIAVTNKHPSVDLMENVAVYLDTSNANVTTSLYSSDGFPRRMSKKKSIK